MKKSDGTAAVRRKKTSLVLAALLLCALLLTAAFWQGLTCSHVRIETDKLTHSVRFAVISDLHSTLYGENQRNLVELLQDQSPDLVLLTGDIVDDERPYDAAKALLSRIADRWPCFYVTGNHEYWSGEAVQIKEMIASYGVAVLSAESCCLTVRDQPICIMGVDDPDAFADSDGGAWYTQVERCAALTQEHAFCVLLSHRPERAQAYEGRGFDLVVCGHAHGGQIRIPYLLDGLYAPNQGFFPAYTDGVYPLDGETSMVVSRGLCKNALARICNPPQLVIIDAEPVG